MTSIDEQLLTIRRMWTYRAFVWGIRFLLAAFLLAAILLVIPGALGLDVLLTWTGIFGIGGLLLGVPFRVLAYWKLDVPYVRLFQQALHDALRARLTWRITVRNPALVRPAQRAAAVSQAEDLPADSPAERLNAIGRSWPYRVSVWGHRIILACLLSFCGGNLFPQWPMWTVLWPGYGIVVGFLMTMPLRLLASARYRVPPGRIQLRVLRDVLNPTVF